MRWAGHVERMGDINAYNILVGKARREWEDNIRLDLK
jgi:hypothetical protein